MNARELLDLIDKHASPHSVRADGLDVKETILRALRLLAAAEDNDWTKAEVLPSFIAIHLCSDYTRGKCGDPAYDDCCCQKLVRGYEQINNERNGLAARVVELEKELQAHRVHLVEAIYGQPCPTPRQWEQMQEVAVKAMGARGSKP